MAEGINVRLSGALRKFVQEQAGPEGLYGSASEYVRDLVRKDFEREEERRWNRLHQELRSGIEATDDELVDFEPNGLVAEARERFGA